MYLIRQLKDWFKTSKALQTTAYFLGLATILTISPEALAQESFPFSPTPGDLSIKLIGKIFGGLITAAGGAGTGDPFGDTIGAFNAAVLAVGGILAAYTIFSGTVGTAHDGEMLGKKFSSAWVPIRTALGSALVLPIVGKGYCVMQVIVMWLVFQGVGLADVTWSAFFENQDSGIYTIVPPAPDVRGLANNIFLASVCVEAMKKEITKDGAISLAVKVGLMPKDWSWNKNTERKIINFGAKDGLPELQNICGYVSYGSSIKKLPTAGDSVEEVILKATSTASINKKQEEATDILIQNMQPLAIKIVNNEAVNPDDIDAAIVGYQKTLVAAAVVAQKANTGSETFSDIKKSSKEQGWFVAGAWYIKIVSATNKISSAVSSVPQSGAIHPDADGNGGILRDAFSAISRAEKVIGMTKGNSRGGILNINPETKPAWYDMFGVFWAEIKESVIASFTGMKLSNLSTRTEHPIVIMNMLGHSLITSATNMFATVAVINGALGGAATVGTNIVLTIMPLITLIAGAMIGSGFMLSYYIPMVPFLIWVGAILGWTILVVEAVIAAPLWAVMHLHPHGDDLTGKGGAGYMLVLGLVIRPVLMIFGLIASLVIVQVFGDMLNKIYYDALIISSEDNPGLFGIIFGFVIYVALMTTFINKAFSIIHVIPDQLLRYIGGGGEQLGQYAGAFTQSGQGAATAAGAVAGSQMGSTIAQGGQAFAGRMQNAAMIKNQKAEAETSKANNDAQMNASLPGKSDFLDAARKDGEKNGGGHKGGQEAVARENSKLATLEQIGDKEAQSDYVRRGTEALGVSGGSSDAAFDRSRAEGLERRFGPEATKFINDQSDGGKNPSEEFKAILAASAVIGSIPSESPTERKNAAQEIFAEANALGNPEEKKNFIKDVRDNGTIAKSEEKKANPPVVNKNA